MDDNEDDTEVYDEDDIQDESFSSPVTDYGDLAFVVSLLRQFFCVSSVALLPYHFPLFDHLGDFFLPQDDENDMFIIRATGYVVRFFGESTTMEIVYLFLGAIITHVIGRKFIIVLCNVSYLFLATFAYFFYWKHHVGLLLAILQSMINEFSVLIFHLYIAEIASTTFRGFFLGSYFFIHTIGSAITLKYLENDFQTKPLIFIAIMVAGFSSLLSIFVPESPFWLASKGKPEAAEQTFFWMKAGSSQTSDVTEFDLLLDVAQEREEEGIAKKVFSRTFVVCWTFAVVLNFCGIHPCDVQRLVVNDFFFPETFSVTAMDDAYAFYGIWNQTANQHHHIYLGCLLFFVLSFVLPRKIMFVISFLLGTLLIVPVLLKIKDPADLARISLYCFLIAHAGVLQLIYIIPVEIFPATSREFGIATSFAWFYIVADVEGYIADRPLSYLGEYKLIYRKPIYFYYLLSIVGIPYLMFFMPETKDRTMYDFREINPFFLSDEGMDEGTLEQLEEG